MCLLVMAAGTSCGLLNHHSRAVYHESISKAPFDVVIVPGLPYDTGNINPLFKARMLWAKELYETGVARHIIFSGSAVHSPYVEGVVMKIMADSMGIPSRHTFIEDKALHSNENVVYGLALAQSMGFKNVAVATDPIQMMVLKKYTRDNHAHVSMLPFSIKSMAAYYKAPFPKVNAEDAFVENFVPLKQRELPIEPVRD